MLNKQRREDEAYDTDPGGGPSDAYPSGYERRGAPNAGRGRQPPDPAGGVALFSLLMQWVKPSDGVIRVFNQVLKLLSIALGVWSAVGRGGEKGLMRGAAVGLGYMGLGVALYAILSGQQAAFFSYLADLAMGIAGGGIVGMILSNISAK